MPVSLKDVVKSACQQHGLDFDNIREVKLDNEYVPTQVKVWFNFNPEPLVLDLKYPDQG